MLLALSFLSSVKSSIPAWWTSLKQYRMWKRKEGWFRLWRSLREACWLVSSACGAATWKLTALAEVAGGPWVHTWKQIQGFPGRTFRIITGVPSLSMITGHLYKSNYCPDRHLNGVTFKAPPDNLGFSRKAEGRDRMGSPCPQKTAAESILGLLEDRQQCIFLPLKLGYLLTHPGPHPLLSLRNKIYAHFPCHQLFFPTCQDPCD